MIIFSRKIPEYFKHSGPSMSEMVLFDIFFNTYLYIYFHGLKKKSQTLTIELILQNLTNSYKLPKS